MGDAQDEAGRSDELEDSSPADYASPTQNRASCRHSVNFPVPFQIAEDEQVDQVQETLAPDPGTPVKSLNSEPTLRSRVGSCPVSALRSKQNQQGVAMSSPSKSSPSRTSVASSGSSRAGALKPSLPLASLRRRLGSLSGTQPPRTNLAGAVRLRRVEADMPAIPKAEEKPLRHRDKLVSLNVAGSPVRIQEYSDVDVDSQASDDRSSTKTKTSRISESTHFGLVDQPMDYCPWCGKCAPLRPYGILPLKPDDVNHRNVQRNRQSVFERQLGHRLEGNPGGKTLRTPTWGTGSTAWKASEALAFGKESLAAIKASLELEKGMYGTELFAKHVQLLSKGIPYHERVKSIPEIYIGAPPTQSRFSRERRQGDGVLPVLLRLTQFELGRLECWVINHVKLQYMKEAIQERPTSDRKDRKHQAMLQNATMCQLLKRLEKKKLTESEVMFLRKKISALPFLQDVPTEMLASVIQRLKSYTYTFETEVFQAGDEADGIYVLLQGTVRMHTELHGQIKHGVEQEAPYAILPGDIVKEDRSFPFQMHNQSEFHRSRTVVACLGEKSPLVTLLFVSNELIREVAAYYGSLDAKNRMGLVTKDFALAMRLAPGICSRNSELFDVHWLTEGHVMVQAGGKPPINVALLTLILEGEVVLVRPQKLLPRGAKGASTSAGSSGGRPAKVASQQDEQSQERVVLGRGKVIGEAAIYGEPYPHTAIATKTSRVISIRVQDYLNRLLHQTHTLERAVAKGRTAQQEAETQAADTTASGNGDDCGQDEATGGDGTTSATNVAHDEGRMYGLPGYSRRVDLLMQEAARTQRIKEDLQSLHANEWKILGKGDLPSRRLPQVTIQHRSPRVTVPVNFTQPENTTAATLSDNASGDKARCSCSAWSQRPAQGCTMPADFSEPQLSTELSFVGRESENLGILTSVSDLMAAKACGQRGSVTMLSVGRGCTDDTESMCVTDAGDIVGGAMAQDVANEEPSRGVLFSCRRMMISPPPGSPPSGSRPRPSRQRVLASV